MAHVREKLRFRTVSLESRFGSLFGRHPSLFGCRAASLLFDQKLLAQALGFPSLAQVQSASDKSPTDKTKHSATRGNNECHAGVPRYDHLEESAGGFGIVQIAINKLNEESVVARALRIPIELRIQGWRMP